MKVVLAIGCFDPLHYGHLVHLQTARTLGDVLIVGVTVDDAIDKPGHPVFPLHQRIAMLQALAIVDKVIPNRSVDETIRAIQPHVYVKGREYEGCLPEQKLVESYGGEVVFTHHDEASKIKSSAIMGYYKNDKQPLEPD